MKDFMEDLTLFWENPAVSKDLRLPWGEPKTIKRDY
jgi:hypothetical protein